MLSFLQRSNECTLDVAEHTSCLSVMERKKLEERKCSKQWKTKVSRKIRMLVIVWCLLHLLQESGKVALAFLNEKEVKSEVKKLESTMEKNLSHSIKRTLVIASDLMKGSVQLQ